MEKKKIVYVDMDNVLADYLGRSISLQIDPNVAKHVPGFFKSLLPIKDAIEAYNELTKYYDVYILTSASWTNPGSFAEKVEWVNKYLPAARKRIIFSNQKNLNMGDYLIDDRPAKGAAEFTGKWIQFGSLEFPDWKSIVKYLTMPE